MTDLSTTQASTFDTVGIETVTVGIAGYYDIIADGAQGGASTNGGGSGGLGAMASGEIYLQAGAKLEIVVGGEGMNSHTLVAGSGGRGGGGGGSFVIETFNGSSATDVNEVIAGGGGSGGGGGASTGGGGQTLGTGGAGAGPATSSNGSVRDRRQCRWRWRRWRRRT
jgi:hypothetical protein